MPPSAPSRAIEETLVAGIAPAVAIRLAEAAALNPIINDAPPDQFGLRPKAERLRILQAIGKALPNPLGAEHATALRKLVNGFCGTAMMLDWLAHAPTSLRDRSQIVAERYAKANPALTALPKGHETARDALRQPDRPRNRCKL